MIRRLFFVIILCLFPAIASAHQLATDGSIGAVIHIDPADDPIATENASFYFDVQDKANQFSLDHCQCTALVMQGGKELYSQQLSTANLKNASFSYVFPAKGVYQVKIIGVPLHQDAFQPFSLSYDIRVRLNPGETVPLAEQPWFWMVISGGGALLVAGGVRLFQRRAPTQP